MYERNLPNGEEINKDWFKCFILLLLSSLLSNRSQLDNSSGLLASKYTFHINQFPNSRPRRPFHCLQHHTWMILVGEDDAGGRR